MEETTTITAVKQGVRMREWAKQIKLQQASEMTVQKWCETLIAMMQELCQMI